MTAHKLNDVGRRRVADYPMRELLDSKSFSLTNKIRIDRFIGCSDQQCDARLTTRLVWERGEFCLNATYFAHGMSDNAIATGAAAGFAGSPFTLLTILPFLTLTEQEVRAALSELESRDLIFAIDDKWYTLLFSKNIRASEPGKDEHTAALPSRREGQVANFIAQGLTNHQIAARLGLSERTIETYVRRLFAKLHVCSRSEVAAWFVNHLSK